MAEEGKHELEIVRVIDASPEEIFDAWTDPRSMEEWFLPGDMERAPIKADVRVGGKFTIDMVRKAEMYPHTGEYLRIERPRLLEFTWISNATNQQRSVVTIELSPKGKATELRLTHRLLPNEDQVRGHTQGWTDIVNKLAAHLGERPSRPQSSSVSLGDHR